MADGGGARPKSKRGRGFRWSEGVVQAWEAVGNGVALERGVREVWVMEERTAFRARFETVGRRRGERGKGRERGGPAMGVPCGAGRRRGTWSQPAGGARQRPERGARGRCRLETKSGELTGGPRHSVGRRFR
jgi:hypothetical protein